MMTFHQDKNILVIATKQEVAKNLVTKVRVMHANLPSWLKQKCVEDNKLNLRYIMVHRLKQFIRPRSSSFRSSIIIDIRRGIH